MLRQKLSRAIALTALAGISASTMALSAGPERPRAHGGVGSELGQTAQIECRKAHPPRIEPARLALLARCMTGSDEIALRPARALHERESAARGETAFARAALSSERGCAQGPRAAVARHAVCYAAILPEREAADAGD